MSAPSTAMFRRWRTDGRAALEPHYAQEQALTEIGRAYYRRSSTLPARPRRGRAARPAPSKRVRGGGFAFIAIRSLRGSIAPIATAYLRDYPEVSIATHGGGDQIIDL